ncbi:MAG TPA: PPOX class F420-dependent oxidoreductase [Ktedonobacterales bacterium]|nr:PPOX class F420-dependent oxidoreductase [Ktedonobacterales bacterium]
MTTSIQPAPLTALARERYISLTTFRKTGAAVATPVWFVQVRATLYVYSDATAGKVKRIRNNPQVRFAACTLRGAATGPAFEGKARILTNPREIGMVEAAISKKYGLTRRLLRVANRLSGMVQRHRPKTGVAYLAITPIGS